MTKRNIIAVLSGTIFSLGLLAGCSQNIDLNDKLNGSNANLNHNKTDGVSKENNVDASGIIITEIKVNEEMFLNKDLSIDIENINAEYNGFVGDYDVWTPPDSSCLYVLKEGSDNVILKLSLNNDKFKPKGNRVLGAEDYGSFYCVPYLGEIFYVNSLDELVVIDLNEAKPKASLVDIDFSVNYIAGCFVSVDEAEKREIYVVSNEGELYRIDYVDAEQDGSGIYKLDGYDNVKFSDILKGKDSSTVSVVMEGDYADSPTLVIRKLDSQNKVERTVINVEYDEYYSEVSLSLK